jgi:fibrillarin-like rRNA methylase
MIRRYIIWRNNHAYDERLRQVHRDLMHRSWWTVRSRPAIFVLTGLRPHRTPRSGRPAS